MAERCRMVTQDGQQCTRSPAKGGMGFCWQHVPVKAKADREKWKQRLEGAALVVSASELLIKIIELAVEYCQELFGDGGEQVQHKRALERDLGLHPMLLGLPESYDPGARVDWESLHYLLREARLAGRTPESYARHLEEGFDSWFERLNHTHKNELLRAIEQATA